MDFSNQRQSYELGTLDIKDVSANPFELLKLWVQQAVEQDVPEPYAMSLATCGEDKMPAVRIVLMREISKEGIVFYTNYLSAKAEDIAENPQAEVLFFWHQLQRQVRLRGSIAKVSQHITDAYFQKRPYDSQIGAWVSEPQSGYIDSRDEINARFEALTKKYPKGSGVPTPPFWGGYEISAHQIEFWQGRPNRLHDRLLYSKQESSSDQPDWSIGRLLP